MLLSRNVLAGIVVAAYAIQGVVVARLLQDNFNSIDQVNYLIDILSRNEVPLEEFDAIALKNLGLLNNKG